MPPPLYPFLILNVWSWPPVGVSFKYANVVKSANNETQGLLEVSFVAVLVPAGSISCFLFVCLFL